MNQFQNQIGQNQFQNPYMNRNFYQPQNNGINWVQGIEGAKAFQLAPNSNVMLLDSENEGRFYIKMSDNVGMCSLRIFSYTEITEAPRQSNDIDLSQYVKKSELESMLNSLLGGVNNEQSVSTNGGKSKAIITK